MNRGTLTIPFTSFLNMYTGLHKPTDIFLVNMFTANDEVLNLELAWSQVKANSHMQTLYWRQAGKVPNDWIEVIIDTSWLSAVVYL